jgi:hypothetical protein
VRTSAIWKTISSIFIGQEGKEGEKENEVREVREVIGDGNGD